jgi:hypothetical protein
MKIKRRLKITFLGVGKASGDVKPLRFVNIPRLDLQAWLVTPADVQ